MGGFFLALCCCDCFFCSTDSQCESWETEACDSLVASISSLDGPWPGIYLLFLDADKLNLLLVLVLNSCGFHLRKPIELDFQSYAIKGDSSGLSTFVRKQFSFAGIEENNNDDGAELIIEIINNNYSKRILSLAGNGQVGEFELVQTVEYRFKSKGQWSVPRRLEAIRELSYDPTLYNAAAAEEALLKNSMIEQLSRSLISEINNLGK